MGWRGEKKVGEDSRGFYTILAMLTNGQVSATNLAWQTSFFFFAIVRFLFSRSPRSIQPPIFRSNIKKYGFLGPRRHSLVRSKARREMWTKKNCLLRMGMDDTPLGGRDNQVGFFCYLSLGFAWQEVERSLVVRFMYMYMDGILRIKQAEAEGEAYPLNVMTPQTTEGQGPS